MSLPTISVVTVCLNDQLGLQATFESLEAQTSPPRQWIVVDGGSSDGTRDWLSLQQWLPLAWTSERDGGIYSGMNRGLGRVEADYVLFLNSGDTLAATDVLASVAGALAERSDPPALLYGDCLVLEPDNRVWLRRSRPPGWTPLGMPASHQSMFFRVASLPAGFDTRYRLSADYALVLGMYRARNGSDFLRVARALCRFRPGGRSDQQRDAGLREDLQIRRRVLGMSRAASYSLHAAHHVQSWIKRRLPAMHRLTRYRRS